MEGQNFPWWTEQLSSGQNSGEQRTQIFSSPCRIWHMYACGSATKFSVLESELYLPEMSQQNANDMYGFMSIPPSETVDVF